MSGACRVTRARFYDEWFDSEKWINDPLRTTAPKTIPLEALQTFESGVVFDVSLGVTIVSLHYKL